LVLAATGVSGTVDGVDGEEGGAEDGGDADELGVMSKTLSKLVDRSPLTAPPSFTTEQIWAQLSEWNKEREREQKQTRGTKRGRSTDPERLLPGDLDLLAAQGAAAGDEEYDVDEDDVEHDDDESDAEMSSDGSSEGESSGEEEEEEEEEGDEDDEGAEGSDDFSFGDMESFLTDAEQAAETQAGFAATDLTDREVAQLRRAMYGEDDSVSDEEEESDAADADDVLETEAEAGKVLTAAEYFGAGRGGGSGRPDDDEFASLLEFRAEGLLGEEEAVARVAGGRRKGAGGEEEEDEEESSDDDMDDEPSVGGSGVRFSSAFTEHQQEQAATIASLEAAAIAPKPWFLQGETNATARPVNSLLELDVDFEHGARSRPPPSSDAIDTAAMVEVGTEVVSLDEIIRRRVRDGAFDDVVRRKPVDEEAFARALADRSRDLQHTKSELSLAALYEADFLAEKARAAEDAAATSQAEVRALRAAASSGQAAREDEVAGLLTTDEHREAHSLFLEISSRLDALASYRFTPHPPTAPQLRPTGLRRGAASTVEEATPTAASVASLVAPEEVLRVAKAGEVGEAERTSAERRAERRRIKAVVQRRAGAVDADGSVSKSVRKAEEQEAARSVVRAQDAMAALVSGGDSAAVSAAVDRTGIDSTAGSRDLYDTMLSSLQKTMDESVAEKRAAGKSRKKAKVAATKVKGTNKFAL
jgi:U3 small nucleolar RNA-associated protein MPP10